MRRDTVGAAETCSTSPPAPIYLVEDDEVLRRTILRALHGANRTARAYERAADFLAEAPALEPGCLITDLNMPGIDGLELIRRVQAGGLPFRCILITGHAQIRLAVEAMKAGACDFIEKPFDRDALLTAIDAALAGVEAAPPAHELEDAARLASLTARERAVLDGVVGGATNKAIARTLAISPRTVEVYRANLMRKTGAASLSELVRLALRVTAPDRR